MQLELDGSVYDTPTDEPVVYHVFEFFKAELLTDDDAALESLTHIDIVTQQLGPEECGTLLVPFLTGACLLLICILTCSQRRRLACQ